MRVAQDNPAFLTIEQAAGTDRLELFVYADEKAGQARLIAALDNLGKGAAGAAVQNLNIALGLDEGRGAEALSSRPSLRRRPEPLQAHVATSQHEPVAAPASAGATARTPLS